MLACVFCMGHAGAEPCRSLGEMAHTLRKGGAHASHHRRHKHTIKPKKTQCEAFQKTGSFKVRGALNALAHLPPGVQDVVTHSSGNHAQALAYAARAKGLRAHIVMPRTAPAIKVAAVKGYGGQVYLCEPTVAAREAMAAELVAKTGGALVHPSDDDDVIAGQVGGGEGKYTWVVGLAVT